MWHIALYWVCLLACAAYAGARGAAPERIAVASLVVASIATILCQAGWFEGSFSGFERDVFLVDVAFFCVVMLLALAAHRFWTLWLASLQLVQVETHLVRLADGAGEPFAYALLLAIWGYLMVLVIAIGVRSHARRLSSASDPSWRPSVLKALETLRSGSSVN
jgi:hypothetical protein